MRLKFRQRILAWFDSYDIYDENDNVVFVVKGQLSCGHCLKIYDANGRELGMIKQKIITLLPKYDLYEKGNKIGSMNKEFSLFIPRFDIDFNGWKISGDIFQWNYQIKTYSGLPVASAYKKLIAFTDTYYIDIANPSDALYALMVVLTIDIDKCSSNKG